MLLKWSYRGSVLGAILGGDRVYFGKTSEIPETVVLVGSFCSCSSRGATRSGFPKSIPLN